MAPGGMMIVATLNRTLRSLALAKVGAEYVLRWVPAGTHDWNKFLTPEEIRSFAEGYLKEQNMSTYVILQKGAKQQ